MDILKRASLRGGGVCVLRCWLVSAGVGFHGKRGVLSKALSSPCDISGKRPPEVYSFASFSLFPLERNMK